MLQLQKERTYQAILSSIPKSKSKIQKELKEEESIRRMGKQLYGMLG